jgi:MYXO-CTERM domain-containing protein
MISKSLLAACAASSLFVGFSASAALVTYNGTGGPIADATTSASETDFDIVISATNMQVNSVVDVTLNGITHTWLGDVGMYLLGPNTDVNNAATYSSIMSPPDGESSNLNGNYVMVVDPLKQTIDEVSGPLTTSQNVPSGTYAISGYGGGTSNGPRTDYNAFVGSPLDGTWTLAVIDFAAPDSGALTNWSITLDVSPIPEPASLAAAGLGGLLVVRRRRA